MKSRGRSRKIDDFIASAHRALRRAARKARQENHRLGLPLIDFNSKKTAAKKRSKR